MDPEIYYRYVDQPSMEENGVTIRLDEYRVVRHTPRGVWIKYIGYFGDWSKEHFVLDDARKRFAYPTKGEALASFIKRKQSQISILETQLARAKAALGLAGRPNFQPNQPYFQFVTKPEEP